MSRQPGTTVSGGALVALVAGMLALVGCTSTPAEDANSVVDRLGAVAIPTAPATPTPLRAAPGHPQLAAMGTTFHATLPGTGSGTVTALGPQIDLPPGTPFPTEQTRATITIRATAAHGSLALHASDFTVRDDQGMNIPLVPVGPATVTSNPARPADLILSGTFHTGAAQINWRSHDAVIAIWTFNIELD
jgi:hypothetical protein